MRNYLLFLIVFVSALTLMRPAFAACATPPDLTHIFDNTTSGGTFNRSVNEVINVGQTKSYINSNDPSGSTLNSTHSLCYQFSLPAGTDNYDVNIIYSISDSSAGYERHWTLEKLDGVDGNFVCTGTDIFTNISSGVQSYNYTSAPINGTNPFTNPLILFHGIAPVGSFQTTLDDLVLQGGMTYQACIAIRRSTGAASHQVINIMVENEGVSAGGGGGASQAECSDGLDNDNDGQIDLADSDCEAANDNTEATAPRVEPAANSVIYELFTRNKLCYEYTGNCPNNECTYEYEAVLNGVTRVTETTKSKEGCYIIPEGGDWELSLDVFNGIGNAYGPGVKTRLKANTQTGGSGFDEVPVSDESIIAGEISENNLALIDKINNCKNNSALCPSCTEIVEIALNSEQEIKTIIEKGAFNFSTYDSDISIIRLFEEILRDADKPENESKFEFKDKDTNTEESFAKESFTFRNLTANEIADINSTLSDYDIDEFTPALEILESSVGLLSVTEGAGICDKFSSGLKHIIKTEKRILNYQLAELYQSISKFFTNIEESGDDPSKEDIKDLEKNIKEFLKRFAEFRSVLSININLKQDCLDTSALPGELDDPDDDDDLPPLPKDPDDNDEIPPIIISLTQDVILPLQECATRSSCGKTKADAANHIKTAFDLEENLLRLLIEAESFIEKNLRNFLLIGPEAQQQNLNNIETLVFNITTSTEAMQRDLEIALHELECAGSIVSNGSTEAIKINAAIKFDNAVLSNLKTLKDPEKSIIDFDKKGNSKISSRNSAVEDASSKLLSILKNLSSGLENASEGKDEAHELLTGQVLFPDEDDIPDLVCEGDVIIEKLKKNHELLINWTDLMNSWAGAAGTASESKDKKTKSTFISSSRKPFKDSKTFENDLMHKVSLNNLGIHAEILQCSNPEIKGAISFIDELLNSNQDVLDLGNSSVKSWAQIGTAEDLNGIKHSTLQSFVLINGMLVKTSSLLCQLNPSNTICQNPEIIVDCSQAPGAAFCQPNAASTTDRPSEEFCKENPDDTKCYCSKDENKDKKICKDKELPSRWDIRCAEDPKAEACQELEFNYLPYSNWAYDFIVDFGSLDCGSLNAAELSNQLESRVAESTFYWSTLPDDKDNKSNEVKPISVRIQEGLNNMTSTSSGWSEGIYPTLSSLTDCVTSAEGNNVISFAEGIKNTTNQASQFIEISLDGWQNLINKLEEVGLDSKRSNLIISQVSTVANDDAKKVQDLNIQLAGSIGLLLEHCSVNESEPASSDEAFDCSALNTCLQSGSCSRGEDLSCSTGDGSCVKSLCEPIKMIELINESISEEKELANLMQQWQSLRLIIYEYKNRGDNFSFSPEDIKINKDFKDDIKELSILLKFGKLEEHLLTTITSLITRMEGCNELASENQEGQVLTLINQVKEIFKRDLEIIKIFDRIIAITNKKEQTPQSHRELINLVGDLKIKLFATLSAKNLIKSNLEDFFRLESIETSNQGETKPSNPNDPDQFCSENSGSQICSNNGTALEGTTEGDVLCEKNPESQICAAFNGNEDSELLVDLGALLIDIPDSVTCSLDGSHLDKAIQIYTVTSAWYDQKLTGLDEISNESSLISWRNDLSSEINDGIKMVPGLRSLYSDLSSNLNCLINVQLTPNSSAQPVTGRLITGLTIQNDKISSTLADDVIDWNIDLKKVLRTEVNSSPNKARNTLENSTENLIEDLKELKNKNGLALNQALIMADNCSLTETCSAEKGCETIASCNWDCFNTSTCKIPNLRDCERDNSCEFAACADFSIESSIQKDLAKAIRNENDLLNILRKWNAAQSLAKTQGKEAAQVFTKDSTLLLGNFDFQTSLLSPLANIISSLESCETRIKQDDTIDGLIELGQGDITADTRLGAINLANAITAGDTELLENLQNAEQILQEAKLNKGQKLNNALQRFKIEIDKSIAILETQLNNKNDLKNDIKRLFDNIDKINDPFELDDGNVAL